VVRVFGVPEYVFPAPSRVFATLVESLPVVAPHAASTLAMTAAGFALSVLAAFAVVVIMDRSTLVARAVYPFMIVSQTVPLVFVAPLFLIWFGYGLAPKLIVVTLVCSFPVALNLADGFRSIDPELLDLFRAMGASWWRTLRIVKIPGSASALFSGLKIAATYSVMGAVIAEWMGSREGLGVYMKRAYQSYSIAGVFAAILVVVASSMAMFGLVRLAEFLVMRGRRP
jgi:ABC-type nitrate/sulfonate/bicarbonate transport system permease component